MKNRGQPGQVAAGAKVRSNRALSRQPSREENGEPCMVACNRGGAGKVGRGRFMEGQVE